MVKESTIVEKVDLAIRLAVLVTVAIIGIGIGLWVYKDAKDIEVLIMRNNDLEEENKQLSEENYFLKQDNEFLIERFRILDKTSGDLLE